MPDATDVAIVGGGPAGAALAIRLARAGIQTTVFERRAKPESRAMGVFSTPLTRLRLADLGFSDTEIALLNRPISALNLETTRGVHCRLEYAHGFACGLDRVRLDEELLERARTEGAEVRMATVVRHIDLPASPSEPVWLTTSVTQARNHGDTRSIKARIIVGADGASGAVGRAAGVYKTHDRFWKVGITFHRLDPTARPDGQPMEGRFVFGRNWYVGVAPVPGSRVNVGMVVPVRTATQHPPDQVSERILRAMPARREAWMTAPTTDRVAFAGRLEHHSARVAGHGFLLVGDAIEFLDPLTGEGVHRAFISAELAADAIIHRLAGDPAAFSVYDRRVRARFMSKNVISWVLQLILARPEVFDYALRRLARRGPLRDQLTLVLTDQARATIALDPRFLVRLLRP